MKKNPALLRNFVFSLVGVLCVLTASSTVLADSLPAPTGKILLTVSGGITKTNSENGAEFDFEMLSQLGLVDKQIVTQWTEPETVFTGVLTRELMALVGAEGSWVRAVAANDYSINIPLTDLTNFDTLLGLSLNGERMRLRDKGPLWLLYPNDNRPDEPESELNNRMVWQLTSLHIQ